MEFIIKDGVLKEVEIEHELKELTIPDGVTEVVINNGVLEKVRTEQPLQEFVIPDGVVIIGKRAFFSSDIERVIVPPSVQVIKELAFHNSGIRSILLSEGLKTIRKDAFHGCSNLYEIVVPESVLVIEPNAFDYSAIKRLFLPATLKSINFKEFFDKCSYLERIDISEQNKVYTSIDGVIFTKDKKTLLYYPQARKDKKYIIPDGTETIESFAFRYNFTENIIISDSVKRIKPKAFCTNLKLRSITFHTKNLNISDSAFMYCGELSEIIIKGEKISMKIFVKKSDDINIDMPPETNGKLLCNIIQYISYPSSVRDHIFSSLKRIDYKAPLALFMIIEYDDEKAKEYISKNISRTVKLFINTDSAEYIMQLIDLGYITKKNIDSYIKYAIDNKKPEMQILLGNFKNNKFGFKSEKSFDKYLL